ncbi:MAG: phage terminase large subunit family protein [Phycisphaerales bacterium]|nr:phage terminase large subunit family protein [Phycisphaerales bacterium]
MPKTYDDKKEYARKRSADESKAGRDIAPLPPVKDHARKQRALTDFRFFCEQYFPKRFYRPWSPDHLKILAKMERLVLFGGCQALAMPRGNGKTMICETAVVWAVVCGHHRYTSLIGASEKHADRSLSNIKKILQNNQGLLDDFPEVCYPIRRLEGQTRRCVGQLYYGQSTQIHWGSESIQIATMPGSRASGAIITVAGITGAIRGQVNETADGSAVRPSLVIVDDPQTEESAKSLTQCEERERIIVGAVVNLGEPGKRISIVMPCTVIRAGDLADRFLDREKHPEWNGERMRLVYTWPTDMEKWWEYAAARKAAMEAGGLDEADRVSNEFYAANREVMDAGGEVSWKERKYETELSAMQHAMNLRIDHGDRMFFAEYQNEPQDENGVDEVVTFDSLTARVSGLARGVVPTECTRLTMFIDVQKKALYWLVAAWSENFSGSVIDYGTFPDQQVAYFTLQDLRYTLAHVFPAAGPEAATEQGLHALASKIIGREWPGEDGSTRHIDRCLIDANWDETSDAVFRFARATVLPVVPSFGRPVGVTSLPFSEYKRKPGERVGLNWRMGFNAQRRRRVVFDANFWKSFVYSRLATPYGDPGSVGFFGKGRVDHRALCEHLTAEKRTRTESRGRVVDQWVNPPGRDNHWFDCLVGAAIAASIEGCAIEAVGNDKAPKVKSSPSVPATRRAPGGQRLSIEELRARRLQQ